MSATASVASEIASDLKANLGIDPISIITILLPILSQLFASCQTPTPASPAQTPQDFLNDHYDAASGTYDSSLIDRTRRHTRQAARQSGQKHLNVGQLDAITVATFDKARTSDDATIQAVMAENAV